MLNIGAGEIIIIGLVLLIVVGPEQLPGVIRRVGRTVAEARSMTENLRSEFMSGMDELERATDPNAWAASAGPSDNSPKIKPSTTTEPTDDTAADDTAPDDDTAADDTAPDDDADETALDDTVADDDVDVADDLAEDDPLGDDAVEDDVAAVEDPDSGPELAAVGDGDVASNGHAPDAATDDLGPDDGDAQDVDAGSDEPQREESS